MKRPTRPSDLRAALVSTAEAIHEQKQALCAELMEVTRHVHSGEYAKEFVSQSQHNDLKRARPADEAKP